MRSNDCILSLKFYTCCIIVMVIPIKNSKGNGVTVLLCITERFAK